MTFSARWKAATNWALLRFINRPGRGRGWSIAIVTTLMLFTGWADYVTYIYISLIVFYLVPVSLAVAWLGWRWALLTAVVSLIMRVVGDYIATDYKFPEVWGWWNVGAALVTFCIVIWMLHALITLHRELEHRVRERTQALEKAATERQRLERDLLEVGSRERNAFGRELHDELGQHLVGTALAAKVLSERLQERSDPNAKDAHAIVAWVEEGIAKTRQLARGLLLSSIDPENLSAELTELANMSSRGGVPCRFKEEGEPMVRDPSTAAQLFRIAQEATSNALRHGQPKHIDIVLAGNENTVCLIVEDDGRGVPLPEKLGSGMGMRIMEHRAAIIGASLSIVSSADQGTKIICCVPVSAPLEPV